MTPSGNRYWIDFEVAGLKAFVCNIKKACMRDTASGDGYWTCRQPLPVHLAARRQTPPAAPNSNSMSLYSKSAPSQGRINICIRLPERRLPIIRSFSRSCRPRGCIPHVLPRLLDIPDERFQARHLEFNRLYFPTRAPFNFHMGKKYRLCVIYLRNNHQLLS